MAARKPKMLVVSRFPAAKLAGNACVEDALKEATAAGQEYGMARIDQQASTRGYRMSPGSFQTHVSGREGVLALDEWWWRFFEFGTVYIEAMPVLRPAHRHARKVLKEKLGSDFEGYIAARAAVRGVGGGRKAGRTSTISALRRIT